MSHSVFIDGQAGTTGLQIADRLRQRNDINVVELAECYRKNEKIRREAMNSVEFAILCLPDRAAEEAAAMVTSQSTRVIDTSTAHRVSDGWTYGLPEFDVSSPERIAEAKLVSNPGCYPVGCILLLRPLVLAGVISAAYPISIVGVSGYTGGGRSLIERFENSKKTDAIKERFFAYGLSLHHKHTPEVMKYGLLQNKPIFMPHVGRFPQGMLISIPLLKSELEKDITRTDLEDALMERYVGQAGVRVQKGVDAIEQLAPETKAGTDDIDLYVFADKANEQFLLCAVYDNLGKGASGNVVQNLDLMIGRSNSKSHEAGERRQL